MADSSVDDVPVLRLDGDIDLLRSDDVRDRLLQLLADSPGQVVVDLTAVSFLDSAGLGALAAGVPVADANGSVITIVCPERLRRLFVITGLDGAFDVVASGPTDARSNGVEAGPG